MSPKPIARFRIFPFPDATLYAIVQIWRTKKDLTEYARSQGHIPFSHNTVAYCHGYSITDYRLGKGPRKRPVFAEINMQQRHSRTGVLTHEIFHATMDWGRRTKFPFRRLGDDDAVNAQEELMAYAHSNMCNQFVRKMYEKGIYSN